jgi:hypothetical protein
MLLERIHSDRNQTGLAFPPVSQPICAEPDSTPEIFRGKPISAKSATVPFLLDKDCLGSCTEDNV